MKTTPHYDRIREFMVNARQEVLDTPTVPSEDVRRLRATLILEEALETVKALGFDVSPLEGRTGHYDLQSDGYELLAKHEPNLVEIADGCADISVVTIGTLIACGIADEPLLEMIDTSNLAKFDTSCPHCGGDGTPSLANNQYRICDDCDEMYRAGYRREDGKWVKPEHWKAPDIAALLAEMGG